MHCSEQFAPAALGENRLVPIPLRLKLSMPRSLDRGARCDPVKKKQTLLCFWLKLKCARMDLLLQNSAGAQRKMPVKITLKSHTVSRSLPNRMLRWGRETSRQAHSASDWPQLSNAGDSPKGGKEGRGVVQGVDGKRGDLLPKFRPSMSGGLLPA